MTTIRTSVCAMVLGLLLSGVSQLAASRAQDADQDDAESSGLVSASPGNEKGQATPVVMRIDNVPIPVKGSDDRYHGVYGVSLENFTGDRVAIDRLEVVNARSGVVDAAFDAAEVAKRLVVRDRSNVPGTMGASQVGILYLHVIYPQRVAI